MKKILLISTLLVITLAICACSGDDSDNLIFDNYEASLQAAISEESGETDINLDDHILYEYNESNVFYNLAHSKTSGSDDEVYYLLRTTDTDDKYITEKISQDAPLAGELSEENPYLGATMENDAGTVFVSVVKVLSDEYLVTYEGKECISPQENVYVQAANHEPELEIKKAKKE